MGARGTDDGVRVRRAIGAGAVPLAAGLALRPPFPLVRAAATLRRDLVLVGPAAGRRIALTLDDGPDPLVTPLVLDVLARHGARATFFLIGERAHTQPQLLRRIAAEGHELGNHLWREERAAGLGVHELEEQLLRTHDVLARVAEPRLWRPGSGLVGREAIRVAARHGYRCVLGSVYPHDAQLPWRPYVVREVAARARPGAIVILHEGKPSRIPVVGTIDEVLGRLVARGLRVVSVSELLRGGSAHGRPARPRGTGGASGSGSSA